MELVSTTEEGSAGVGLSLSPLPVSGGSIGGKAGASLDTTDTQTFQIAETIVPKSLSPAIVIRAHCVQRHWLLCNDQLMGCSALNRATIPVMYAYI